MTANNGDVLKDAAVNGLGISALPCFFVSDDLKAGRLVAILQDAPQPKLGIHVVYPPGLYIQPKTRAFIDFLIAHFKGKSFTDL